MLVVVVWLYGETLLPEFCDELLAQYSVTNDPDWRHLRGGVRRQVFETQYQGPQLPLWELRDGEWLKVIPVPQYFSAGKTLSAIVQQSLVLIGVVASMRRYTPNSR